MNEILVVNKPSGYTSRDVVNKLTKIFHEKRIGHTGTLDPMATGVLVVCIGKYTKLNLELTSLEKEYTATMKLGIETDTLDITGNITKTLDKKIKLDQIQKVFSEFPHEYLQSVPKYSAVKINGKKLYEYARENTEIKLPKRMVKIYSLELMSYENNIIKFKTKVSKGTYIRSLIRDIANLLGTVAVMESLIRTKQGNFSLEDSYNLESIENNEFEFIPLTKALDYKVLDGNLNKIKYINVNKVLENIEDGKYFIKIDNDIKSIYEFKDKLGKPKIMF